MKNRWVKIRMNGKECYGQIEDAGPGQYEDKAYVFGNDDARPKNKEFNGAGMDVSPALNGCLGFKELDGEDDKVDWQFVDRKDVPAGPWLKLETSAPGPVGRAGTGHPWPIRPFKLPPRRSENCPACWLTPLQTWLTVSGPAPPGHATSRFSDHIDSRWIPF